MKKEFISTHIEYADKQSGEIKKYWSRVGELLTIDTKNGGTFQKLNLYMFPNTEFSIFKDEKKDNKQDGF